MGPWIPKSAFAGYGTGTGHGHLSLCPLDLTKSAANVQLVKNKVRKDLRQLHQIYNKIFTSTLQQSTSKKRALSKKECKENIWIPVSMARYDKKGVVKVTSIGGNISKRNDQNQKQRQRHLNLSMTFSIIKTRKRKQKNIVHHQ